MKYIVSILWSGIILSIAFLGSVTYGQQAYNFVGLDTEALRDYFSPIHFTVGGNEFGGGFFWLNTEPANVTITANNGSVTCRRQIRGYYYNPSRGNRLRPLDNKTLQELQAQDPSYNNLTLDGGLYTNCSGIHNSVYARYGQLQFNRKGDISYLLAGIEFDIVNRKYEPRLQQSFESFDNKTALGFIYDTRGGIGFVGGAATMSSCYGDVAVATAGGGSINDLYEYNADGDIVFTNNASCTVTPGASGTALAQMMSNISIQGNIALSKAYDNQDKQSVHGNFGQKSLLQNANVSLGTVMQQVQPVVQSVCRGKWLTSEVNLSTSDDVVCIDFGTYADDNLMRIDTSATIGTYNKKTIIVRNGNVLLQGSMDPTAHINIVIDNGNLLFDQGGTALQGIDAEGYPTSVMGDTVANGLMYRGNFIVKGLMLGFDSTRTPDIGNFNKRVYLYGTVASLSTPVAANEFRIKQVEELTASKDYVSLINIQDVFVRSCNAVSGVGTDGTSCNNPNDKHPFSAVVFTDVFFDNPLLK